MLLRASTLIRPSRRYVLSTSKNFLSKPHPHARRLRRPFSNSSSTTSKTTSSNFPAYLVGLGLVSGGVALVTEKQWRAPIQIATITRLEMPREEFSHPYDKKPWYWKYWFTAKRLTYLVVLWIPCGTVAFAAWLTGDGDVRARFLRLMVTTFEWAGCSFQKFGQWLSMRPDVLAPDVIEALSTLRDDTAEHNMEHNRTMFRTSFGAEIEEIFEYFDSKAIASASVGQVHRARLRPEYAMEDGSVEVAVKIRHPRVLDETWIDTTLIFAFMENSGGLLTMPFSQRDFTLMLQKQFDFEWEAYNMSKFAENFSDETAQSVLAFPAVSGDLLSPSVLVESWGKGKSVDALFSTGFEGDWNIKDTNQSIASKILMKKKNELATIIFDMNMKMFLRDNFIHGDLHAGNLLYDEESGALTVLDAGLISQIPMSMNTNFVLFIQGMCAGDASAITDQLLVFDNRNTVAGQINQEVFIQREQLLKTVQKACDHWVNPKTGMAPDGNPISVGDLMGEIMFGLNEHGMLMNGAVASTLLTISISEGLIRSLDPSFDMITKSWPYLVTYSDSDLLKQTGSVAADKIQNELEVVVKDGQKGINDVVEKAGEKVKEVGDKVIEVKDDVVIVIEEGKKKVDEAAGDLKEEVEQKIDVLRKRATGAKSLAKVDGSIENMKKK